MDQQIPLQDRAQVDDFRRKHLTGLLTLLFTDIVGSGKLKAELGDQQGLALIHAHHASVRELLGQFSDAQEISTAGDSFFIVFARPSEGVKFALMLQARLKGLSTSAGQKVSDRIGIHVGEVFIESTDGAEKPKDLFGLQVDVAAWVMSLARGDQILVTRFAFDNARQVLKGEDIEGLGPLSWVSHGSYQLRGTDQSVEVCEVTSSKTALLSPPSDSHKARKITSEGELVLGWRPAIGQEVPNTSWVLEEKLGEGGFGEVWLGRHRQLKDQRVFKFCFLADRVRSLKREVTLFRLLKERAREQFNIVRLHDVCLEQPPYYLVEEYVEGRDLGRWSEKQGGIEQVPVETRLEIVAQAAEALQAAHEAGIVHRDIKPGNILIRATGRQLTDKEGTLSATPVAPATLGVKLTDFGIGQVLSAEALVGVTRAGLTRTLLSPSSSQTGTQLYMAPELLAGKPASTRSDIYALGVVLYQLMVGDFQRPVTTEWAEDIVDPLLRDDLKRCFARNPRDRFAGAGQLAESIRSLHQRRRALLEQQAVLAARERAAFRRGILRTGAIASLILLVILALAWQVRSNALAKYRQAAQIRSTTVRLTVANGVSLANSGDWLSAGLWFSEAFLLDEGFRVASDPQLTRQTHRLRLNSVLRQSPRLEQMWFDEGSPSGGFDLAGQHVLLGSTNGYRLYSILSGQPASPRVGQGRERASLRPDGRQVVTGGGATNSLFTLWEAPSGARLFDLHEMGGEGPFRSDCTDLEFSPDGRWIAAPVSGPGGRVVIWDAESGRARRAIDYADAPNVGWTNNGNFIVSARFDASGQRLVTTGAEDHRAVVWQWETGRALHVLAGHGNWVYSGCFGQRHTNWLLTCSFDRTARLWDLRTEQCLVRVEHEGDAIRDVQFSPDDRLFLTGGLDSTVRFWDSETGRMVPPILRDHSRVIRVLWSADGRRVLTLSYDRTARVWRLRSQEPVAQATQSDFSADGRWALTFAGATGRVQEAAGGRDLAAFKLASTNVSAFCFAGGPDRLFCFSRLPGSTPAGPSQVRLWQIARNAPVGAPHFYDPSWSHCLCAPGGRRFAFYPAAATNAPAGGAQGVFVWEPARPSMSRMIAFTNEAVESVAFDPEGRRMAIASQDRTTEGGVLRLADLDAARRPTLLRRFRQRIAHVTFSGDGRWLAAACWDESMDPGAAVIWRVGERGRSFTEAGRLAHLDGVLYATFSDSGQTIATASEDQTAIVWHLADGTWEAPLRPLRCGGQVYACSFSHNGRWLATACRAPESQGTKTWSSHIRIWDVANGEPISLPVTFSNKVTRLAFVADDTRLFVERWLPPAAPERWVIDLAVNEGSPQEFLLRTELLSAQRSFLSGRAQQLSRALQGGLSAEEKEILVRAASVGLGPLRPLSKEYCHELWLGLSSGVAPPP